MEDDAKAELLAAILDLKDATAASFAKVDKRFDTVDRRFDAVDRRFNAVDKRFDRIDVRLDEIAAIGNSHEGRIQRLEDRDGGSSSS